MCFSCCGCITNWSQRWQNKSNLLCNKTPWRPCHSCQTCSNKQNAIRDSHLECTMVSKSNCSWFYLNKSSLSHQSFRFILFVPTLLFHLPMVYDGDKVVGHKCKFSGFSEVPCCLNLHRFCLWMNKEKRGVKYTEKYWKSSSFLQHLKKQILCGKDLFLTSATMLASCAKLGLSAALQAQHFLMTTYSSWGQSGGLSRRSPSRSTRHRICIKESKCQRY